MFARVVFLSDSPLSVVLSDEMGVELFFFDRPLLPFRDDPKKIYFFPTVFCLTLSVVSASSGDV